jgi:hypothetical protein
MERKQKTREMIPGFLLYVHQKLILHHTIFFTGKVYHNRSSNTK